MKRACIAIGGLLIASPCIASNWQLIYQLSTGSKIYLDLESITAPSPGVRKGWFKVEFATPVAVGSEWETSELMLEQARCAEQSLAGIKYIQYAEKGVVINSVDFAPVFSEQAPDTAGISMVAVLCASPIAKIRTPDSSK